MCDAWAEFQRLPHDRLQMKPYQHVIDGHCANILQDVSLGAGDFKVNGADI